jgi:hypothetical protein
MVEFVEQWGIDDEGARRLTSGEVVATDGRWKVVRRSGQEVLFDLHADPLELDGRAPGTDRDEPAVEHLRACAADAEEPKTIPDLVVGEAPPEPSDDEVARIEAQMRLLGYL